MKGKVRYYSLDIIFEEEEENTHGNEKIVFCTVSGCWGQ
jgi:hypothetical protein